MVNIDYKTVYGDHQSDGWHPTILYAPNGENNDWYKNMRITRRFFGDLGLQLFTVHIARNDYDSWLWEHRDYVELNEEKQRLRLHVPLISKPDAIMQFPQCKVNMAPGWIWKLDPTVSHAISNNASHPGMV